MPTFTTVALERLLESSRRVRDTETHQPYKSNNNSNNNINSDAKKRPQHIFICPALYTTPDPQPIPHSSSTASVSPSPYVVNCKRRDFSVPEALNRLDGFEIPKNAEAADGDNGVMDVEGQEEGLAEECAVERDERCDDSMSAASCSGIDDSQNDTSVANRTEFYDADEEFFSDGSVSNASPLFSPNIVVDLHAARVSLFDEIERRKRAEDALAQMRNQWQGIHRYLSQGGQPFPMNWDAGKDAQIEMDLAEKICQEVVVARFVSEAIGRGQARAETEAAAEIVIESKNQKISRLRDKLQYYESVNREMSQRNQEAVETSRRQWQRRKTKQRWIWSCIGLSITLGASILAYSYLPQMSRNASVATDDFSDSPSGEP